jgi:hypothetical protein
MVPVKLFYLALRVVSTAQTPNRPVFSNQRDPIATDCDVFVKSCQQYHIYLIDSREWYRLSGLNGGPLVPQTSALTN